MARGRLIVRANAGPELGFGHLERCCGLVDALAASGSDVLLVANDDAPVRAFTGSRPAVFVRADASPSSWPAGDACVVDLYCYDSHFYAEAAQRFRRVAIFDDDGHDIPGEVHAVINANLHAEDALYPRKVVAIAGAQYHGLRAEFLGDGVPEHSDHVFLCLGGSDPEMQTARLARVLIESTSRRICAVFGPDAAGPHTSDSVWSEQRVIVKRSPRRVSDLMRGAAFAVSGAGLMLYELAFLGVPTACLVLAANQAPVAEAFRERNAALVLGDFRTVSDLGLAGHLREFDRDACRRKLLGARGRGLIDGRGADRLAARLLEWLNSGV